MGLVRGQQTGKPSGTAQQPIVLAATCRPDRSLCSGIVARTEGGTPVCDRIAEIICEAFVARAQSGATGCAFDPRHCVVDVMKLLVCLGLSGLAGEIVDSVVADLTRFPIAESVVPACAALDKWLSAGPEAVARPTALDRLIMHAVDTLRERTWPALPTVSDWTVQWPGCGCKKDCCKNTGLQRSIM